MIAVEEGENCCFTWPLARAIRLFIKDTGMAFYMLIFAV